MKEATWHTHRARSTRSTWPDEQHERNRMPRSSLNLKHHQVLGRPLRLAGQVIESPRTGIDRKEGVRVGGATVFAYRYYVLERRER
ncbi:unnamed protein product [Durusdinium trenchii]|uniref:Uncharacterized protein n=2 Tax=Durusdinium trenchii TaxID=1381693 RepID=A0ABP0SSV2_9DINO